MTDPAATTLREAQKQFTRRRLLDAAQQVFETAGYSAATIDDIARTSGASRATFYLHFASKLEVFRELSAALVDEAAAYYGRLDEVLSAGSRRDLRDWMDEAVGWFERHRALLPAVDEAAAVEPEIASQGVGSLDVFADSMPEYLKAWPAERQDEARLRVALLVIQLSGFFRAWALSETWQVDRDLVLDVLAEIWGAALRRPRA